MNRLELARTYLLVLMVDSIAPAIGLVAIRRRRALERLRQRLGYAGPEQELPAGWALPELALLADPAVRDIEAALVLEPQQPEDVDQAAERILDVVRRDPHLGSVRKVLRRARAGPLGHEAFTRLVREGRLERAGEFFREVVR